MTDRVNQGLLRPPTWGVSEMSGIRLETIDCDLDDAAPDEVEATLTMIAARARDLHSTAIRLPSADCSTTEKCEVQDKP